jgi:radical SAM superfamily enzyme YgiQ (UPF0313 family)
MKDFHRGMTNCLIVQTKFSEYSFWNYKDVCTIVGAKYPAAPLGLLTLAALLPQHWTFRLIDENVEPLMDGDLQWADIVCTGGMLPQQMGLLELISRAHKMNRTIVVGGSDPTSQPELYKEADFLVLGEGEVTIPIFIDALYKGAKTGVFVSEIRADMLNAVVPRYDLIRFSDYIMIGVQFVRGCPYNCEFCDIIEQFGRVPRFKTTEQVIKELQSLYDLGHRGHIDFVDDNFIGNKKRVKELLREIKRWSIAHKYPFYFSTEASVNLADDDELLQLMKDVDFRYVFLGIETPESETLELTNKNQNLNKSVVDVVAKIMSYGIICNGGFIIGFDSDSPEIGNNMIACIQNSGICMAMLGQLYALPNTQLTRRLEAEGRLFHNSSKSLDDFDIDQATSGLNFVTKMPRIEIIDNYVRVIEYIYDPSNYYKRVIYNGLSLKTKYRYKPDFITFLKYMRSFLISSKRIGFNKVTGLLYWKMFFTVLFKNPKGIEPAVNLAVMFIHFQKQKQNVVSRMKETKKQLEEIGEDAYNDLMVNKLAEQETIEII